MLGFLAVVCGVLLAAALTWVGVSVLRRRRQLARRPGILRCRLRPIGGCGDWHKRAPSRWTYGEWVHDVLVMHGGVLLGGTVALPVRFPEGVIQLRHGEPARKNGTAVLRLRLDDGCLVELGTTEAGRAHLAGPFLAVAALDASEQARHGQERPLG